MHMRVCGPCMLIQPQRQWGRSGWGGGRGVAHQLWRLGEERCLCKQILLAQAARSVSEGLALLGGYTEGRGRESPTRVLRTIGRGLSCLLLWEAYEELDGRHS